MSAGKGDKLRAGANLQSYWENYDNIFRKRKSSPLGEKLQKFNAIRQALISGAFPADLRELRRAIASMVLMGKNAIIGPKTGFRNFSFMALG